MKMRLFTTSGLCVALCLLCSCATTEALDSPAEEPTTVEDTSPESTDAPSAASETKTDGPTAQAPSDAPEGSQTAPAAAPQMPLSALPSTDRSFEMAAGISFRSLGAVDLEDFVRKLNSDRRLLIEVRKEVPQNADEATMYLARLKQLAKQSDPVRLVPLANKLLDQSSIYFEWLNTDFESEEDQAREYYIGGAQGFRHAMDEFRSAVLFLIVKRLEIASRVIVELEHEVLRRVSQEE